MNKELFSYFFVIGAFIVGALYYSNAIQSPITTSLNYLKTSYHNSHQFISDTIDKHFFQAYEIEKLKVELQQYENNHLIMQELANEVDDLHKERNSTISNNTDVALVRAISYEQFGNFNRVWMEIAEYNSSKIYGLTYKELVAGIVINKDDKALALLNQDIKSAYSVYVGDKSAPGIAHGNNNQNLVVNFIPTWFKIDKGDEVTTSGLDNIFFKGLKVGQVLSVTSSQGYQTAIVEPYYKSHEPSYFHIIRSVR
ncbi:MAG: rod shape-determining protein MreC [Campylobacterota bacterium]|nr:rod shape-determining protein MreC [Campylobacterota bacterium]